MHFNKEIQTLHGRHERTSSLVDPQTWIWQRSGTEKLCSGRCQSTVKAHDDTLGHLPSHVLVVYSRRVGVPELEAITILSLVPMTRGLVLRSALSTADAHNVENVNASSR